MALDQFALLEVLEVLKAAEVDDQIWQAAETIYQALIEAELSSVIGAVPHQRTTARTAHRNGHRLWTLSSTSADHARDRGTLLISASTIKPPFPRPESSPRIG